MAKISRKTQSIFAASAANNGQFGSAQAGTKLLSNDPAVLQALAAWAQGWTSAIIGSSKFPCLEEFQALNYINTYQLAYQFQEGIAEYDAGTNYFTKGIVKKTGTYQIYGSVTDNNLGNPLTDAAHWVLLQDLSSPTVGRTRLTTNTTFYVASTGNDSNPGTIGSPWLTLQHAINILWNSYDFAGFAVTISLSAATYVGATTISGPFTGGGSLTILGNGTCILSSASNALSIAACANIQVAGLTLTSSAASGLYIAAGASVSLGAGMNFGACALAQSLCEFGGTLSTSGAGYTISGGGQYHLYNRNNGAVNCVAAVSATVNITGTPTFSTAFVAAEKCSSMAIQNYTWSGAVTAGVVPYSVTYNGVINGVTGLPGSGAPVQSTGGQFS